MTEERQPNTEQAIRCKDCGGILTKHSEPVWNGFCRICDPREPQEYKCLRGGEVGSFKARGELTCLAHGGPMIARCCDGGWLGEAHECQKSKEPNTELRKKAANWPLTSHLSNLPPDDGRLWRTWDVVAFAASIQEEAQQPDNIFWPPENEAEEHLYEIRNGKTAAFVVEHARALLSLWAGETKDTKDLEKQLSEAQDKIDAAQRGEATAHEAQYQAEKQLAEARALNSTRLIPLTQGKTAIVDIEDYELVSQYRWHVRKDERNIYAYRHLKKANPAKLSMHRLILGVTDNKLCIDHIDGNGLNNRRSNLRIATQQQNTHNSRRHRDSKSGVKGVSWNNREKKWRAQITVNKRLMHLGSFFKKEDAANAYREAAVKHFGEFARTE